MIGGYNVAQISDLIGRLKEGKFEILKEKKEFNQARIVFIKQDGRILGKFGESAVLDLMLGLVDKVDLFKPFRIYFLTGKNLSEVKEISDKDSLEFSFMAYHGFALAHEIEGEKIDMIESLLARSRLPVDLWGKSGFKLWKWETQVFDVDGEAIEEV